MDDETPAQRALRDHLEGMLDKARAEALEQLRDDRLWAALASEREVEDAALQAETSTSMADEVKLRGRLAALREIRRPRRAAWLQVKASRQGPYVWLLDTVKDWTVRILVDVGADLRKLNMATEQGRPRSKRGVVHQRYYTTWPKLVSRRIFGRVSRTLYYPTALNEADALKFKSDLAWAVAQVRGEIEELAGAVEVSHKGDRFQLTRASDRAISAAVDLFARKPNQNRRKGKGKGESDRGAAVFALWQQIGLADTVEGPTREQTRAVALAKGPRTIKEQLADETKRNARAIRKSDAQKTATFISRRVASPANWRRDTRAHLEAFRATFSPEMIAGLEDVLSAAKRMTEGRGAPRKPRKDTSE